MILLNWFCLRWHLQKDMLFILSISDSFRASTTLRWESCSCRTLFYKLSLFVHRHSMISDQIDMVTLERALWSQWWRSQFGDRILVTRAGFFHACLWISIFGDAGYHTMFLFHRLRSIIFLINRFLTMVMRPLHLKSWLLHSHYSTS